MPIDPLKRPFEVLMSVNNNFAVLCPEAIPDKEDLQAVYDALKRSMKAAPTLLFH